jgi:tetratricopeptide (TPR) repeat protein
LSKRFAEHAAGPFGLESLAAGALALTLAACGSSTPRQADVEAPREVAPAVASAKPPAAEATAAPERKRDRRSERRAAEAASAEAAAATVAEPVPEAAAAGYGRAIAAMRAQNWVEAELELEQLVLEYPEYPGPHVNLALVYLNDGRRDDARKEIELALGVDPGHAAANTQLGILLREDGKFEAAEAAYRRALETDPDHALAHYNLGVLLDIYLRRTAEALEHYEAYQASLAQPDETVGRWIIDLRRRAGNGSGARVAQGEGP